MENMLLKLPEVVRRCGVAKSSIYSKIQVGEFPQPVRLGQRAVAWRLTDIQTWIDSRTTQPPR